MKIVSGGQTGADRAALDAALAAGVPCGGWCPAGRKAEDGRIPDRYPVVELPGAHYKQRTRQNVIDSDGTLILCFGPADGGTAMTYRYCQSHRKPALLVDAATTPAARAAELALAFIAATRIQTLNVAGPRARRQPMIYDYVHAVVTKVVTAGTTP